MRTINAPFPEKSLRRASPVWFALLLSAAASSTVSAQQSTYMMVDAITGDQVAPHQGEFKLSGFSLGFANTVSLYGTLSGSGVGKATFVPVKVTMHFDSFASPAFYRNLAMGTKMASVEIRFYNLTRMFYKTVFENVYLTNVSTNASDDASQEIEFAYSRVRWLAPTDPAEWID